MGKQSFTLTIWFDYIDWWHCSIILYLQRVYWFIWIEWQLSICTVLLVFIFREWQLVLYSPYSLIKEHHYSICTQYSHDMSRTQSQHSLSHSILERKHKEKTNFVYRSSSVSIPETQVYKMFVFPRTWLKSRIMVFVICLFN